MSEIENAELTYEAVAHRIYTDPDWDTEITEQEARIIAERWVGPHFFPNLWRWVEGQPVAHAILLAEADGLWDNISLNQIGWKHAGEPEPSLAAAAALWRFFAK